MIEIFIYDCCGYVEELAYHYDMDLWDCISDWLWF